jgi:hypothetical protein
MARRLKVQKHELEKVNYYWLGTFRLKVTVTDDGTGADPNVFLFLRAPANPTTGETTDYFHGVAGPVDMEDYPAHDPSARTTYPFYRASEVTVDFRNLYHFQEAWTIIVAEITHLLQALDRLDLLVPSEAVFVGTPAGDDSDGGSSSGVSSSSSSSASEVP